jgi:hypothetical protein
MAFDGSKLVLFGGVDRLVGASTPVIHGDTWTFDGNAWTHIDVSPSPPARAGHAMAWDPATGRVLLFGGYALEGMSTNSFRELADAWAWDGTAWHTVSSTSAPAPRSMSTLAFDNSRGRMVMFGGEEASIPYDDTWELAFVGTVGSTLAAISTIHQTGLVTQPLLQAFTVRVLDAHGLGVRGVPVHFAPISGDGSIDVNQSTSDAFGRAHAQGTCGMKAGDAAWSASLEGGPSVTFRASCQPSATVQLSISTATSAGVGVPIEVRVSALDRFGNVSHDLADALHFQSGDPDASLPLDQAVPSAGVLDLPHGVTFATPGLQYLEVMDPARPSAIMPARMSNILVIGGRAPPSITISPESVGVKVGTNIAIEVTAMDPDGLPVSLAAKSLPSGASFPDVKDVMAHQIFSWIPSAGQAGRYEITFKATGVSNATSEASAVIVVRGSYYGCSEISERTAGAWRADITVVLAAALMLTWRALRSRRGAVSLLGAAAIMMVATEARAASPAEDAPKVSNEGVTATASVSGAPAEVRGDEAEPQRIDAPLAGSARPYYMTVGVRTDADVAGNGIGFGASVGAGMQMFGGNFAVIVARPGKPRPVGLRLEARLHPWSLGIVEPYLALGATAFVPEVALRAAIGAQIRVWSAWIVTADLALEHFPSPAETRLADPVLLSIGFGHRFD